MRQFGNLLWPIQSAYKVLAFVGRCGATGSKLEQPKGCT